jgi:hypothetical protein
MLTRTRHAAAATTAAVLLVSLGLGGCSSGSNTVVTHTPALQTPGGRDTARSGVQGAILVADTTNGNALPGGPTPASVARRVFAMVRGGRHVLATGAASGACSNGIKSSQVTNSDGSATTTTDYYYEAACTTLEAEEIITIVTPATPTKTDGSGTITSYDKSGNVRVVQKLTIHASTTDPTSTTAASETITVIDNASPTATGGATAGVGVTCVGAPSSATLSCSGAHFGTSASTTTGVAFGTSATAGTSGGNANATVNVAFYAGSLLSIVQSGALWGVSGASAFNTATGTYGYTTTGPSGSGTLTLKDALYTYAETATLASTGLSVTIIQNPNSAFNTTTPIATAAIDVAGTGVLTYSDGATEPIAGGLIGF